MGRTIEHWQWCRVLTDDNPKNGNRTPKPAFFGADLVSFVDLDAPKLFS